jgi:hypothetical protein
LVRTDEDLCEDARRGRAARARFFTSRVGFFFAMFASIAAEAPRLLCR